LVPRKELYSLSYLRNQKALSPLAIALIVLGVAIVVVAGVVVAYLWSGVGNLKTETKQISDFTKLDVSSGFEVTITKSETYKVVVTASERIIGNIVVSKSGDALNIHLQPGTVFGSSTLKAEISMPVLNGVVFSGGTRGTANGFSTTEEFRVELTGASTFEIDNFETGDVSVEVSGASTFNAQGTGNDLVAVVSGASTLAFSDFHVDNATVELSGASHATVYVAGRLDVSASGFSSLQYLGNPTLGNINTSGGSSVTKG
jgi:hypothetical protein